MFKRVAVLAMAVLVPCVSLQAEDVKTDVAFDGSRAKQYVAHLSSDEMEGRMSCTEGYRRAADWVASKFETWGLMPAGEDGTYFQEVSIRGFDVREGVPSMGVDGRHFLLDDGDYSVHGASTDDTTIRGRIVFVGYGISAPDKGLDEYADMDVDGQIALVLTGSPKDAPVARSMLQRSEEPKEEKAEEEWKEESAVVKKIRTAYEKGASAVLLYDPDSNEASRRRSRGGSTSNSFKPERNFLCFKIEERVFRAIMKQEPQESPRGVKRRIDAIRRRIKQKKSQSEVTGARAELQGYKRTVQYDEEHKNNVARNVLAKIEGTDPELKSEYVFVGAHLDHVGVRDGYVYNGADDNASGSAVVLEVARVLSEAKFQPKRTLVFGCWCGEERGLIGSRHYTQHPCDGVTIDKVVAYINIDMVGMGEDLSASEAEAFPSIWNVIVRDQDPEIMKHIKPREGGPGGSDHASFMKWGIEALMLISSGGEGHGDYHQPEDDAAKIEPEMLSLTGQFVLRGMMNLAEESQVQLLIPRRQEMYRAGRMRLGNFNPDLPDSQWTQVEIDKKSKDALWEEIYGRVSEMIKGPAASGNSNGQSSGSGPNRREKQSLARGSADLAVTGDDARLLELAIGLYGLGRFDVVEGDGAWVAEGRLTDGGRAALQILEKNGVVVRLVSPGEELIDDLLAASSKPFIITGSYTIPDNLVERINARGVLMGVDFDPQKVDDFLTRVEQVKSQLGERSNLFAYLTSKEGLDEAKRPLYLGLIDRGWTHNEICGAREHRGLVGGASMGALQPK